MSRQTVLINDQVIEVKYDYHPAERQTLDCPGSPAWVDLLTEVDDEAGVAEEVLRLHEGDRG